MNKKIVFTLIALFLILLSCISIFMFVVLQQNKLKKIREENSNKELEVKKIGQAIAKFEKENNSTSKLCFDNENKIYIKTSTDICNNLDEASKIDLSNNYNYFMVEECKRSLEKDIYFKLNAGDIKQNITFCDSNGNETKPYIYNFNP